MSVNIYSAAEELNSYLTALFNGYVFLCFSERMKAMEEQIASLAGLVHHALSMGVDLPGVKETVRCEHLHLTHPPMLANVLNRFICTQNNDSVENMALVVYTALTIAQCLFSESSGRKLLNSRPGEIHFKPLQQHTDLKCAEHEAYLKITFLSSSVSSEPQNPTTLTDSISPAPLALEAPPSDNGLQKSLVSAKRSVSELRLQLSELRHLQVCLHLFSSYFHIFIHGNIYVMLLIMIIIKDTMSLTGSFIFFKYSTDTCSIFSYFILNIHHI